MILSVCAQCGAPFERLTNGSRCDTCRPPERLKTRLTPTPTKKEAGYDWAWEQLSKRARRLQPFCAKCGTPDDLTVDHTPEAWARKEAGKVIRLQDIVVLCRSHNSSAGAARGPRARPHDRHDLTDPGGGGDGSSEPNHPVKAGARLLSTFDIAGGGQDA